jgi:hypothetical protein
MLVELKEKKRSDDAHIAKRTVILKISAGYFTLTSDLRGSKGTSQKR